MPLIRTDFPTYCAHFPGGDPRRYEPDPDGVTIEEMERWKDACAAADQRGDLAELEGSAVWVAGEGLAHLTMFGPGTYYYDQDPYEEDDDHA